MAKYIEIVEWIKHYISSSKVKPGDKIPPELHICDELGASRQTVRKAIQELTDEGILYSVKGSGTYVAKVPQKNFNTESKNIALLLTYSDFYIFPQKINGMYPVFSSNDYMITIFFTDNSCDKEEKSIRAILNGDFAGVLFEPSRANLPRCDKALYDELFEKLPVIFLDTYLPEYDAPCISIDDIEGAYMATKYLLDNGHKNIMHLGKVDDQQGILRYEGYLKALKEYGIHYSDANTFWITNDFTYGANFYEPFAAALINRLKDVTAVFCYNDLVANEFVTFAQAHNISIPDDISLISFDDSYLAVQHGLTSIIHPKHDLGEIAAKYLIRYIQDPSYNANHTFNPEIVVRGSVKDIN